jgi:uncharacterized membrane protein
MRKRVWPSAGGHREITIDDRRSSLLPVRIEAGAISCGALGVFAVVVVVVVVVVVAVVMRR